MKLQSLPLNLPLCFISTETISLYHYRSISTGKNWPTEFTLNISQNLSRFLDIR